MAIMASVCLTLFINIFFRKSFAFRCDFIQLLLLAGLSFCRPDTLTLALFVAGFGALAIGKEAFPEQLSRVSLLLPNWDKQVTGQSRQLQPNPNEIGVSCAVTHRTYSTSCAHSPSSVLFAKQEGTICLAFG